MKKLIILLLIPVLTGCYTKRQAMDKFGCRIDSVRVDSFTSYQVDTVIEYVDVPGDTVKVKGPCEEIEAMQPGQSKTVKGKRTSVTYGKDSTGRSYIDCMAEAYRQKMIWYREQWRKSVFTTIHQTQKDHANWWQRMKSVKVELLISLLIGCGAGIYLMKR